MAYTGFAKLRVKFAAKSNVKTPGAGYGKATFQKYAAVGKKMRGVSPK